MPRLPDISALGNRPVPVNRQGIAQQDTTAEGRGIAQFGDAVGQVGDVLYKQQQAKQRAEAGLVLAKTTNDLHGLHDEISRGITDGTVQTDKADALFTTKAQEIRGKAIEGLTDNQRRAIADNLETTSGGLKRSLAGNVYKQNQSSMAGMIDQFGEQAQRDALRLGPQWAAEKYSAYVDFNGGAAGLSAAAQQKLKQSFSETAHYGYFDSLGVQALTKNDTEALKALRNQVSGKEGEAIDPIRRTQLTHQLYGYEQSIEAKRVAAMNAAEREQLVRENKAIDYQNKLIDLTVNGNQISPEFIKEATTAAAGTNAAPMIGALLSGQTVISGFATKSAAERAAILERGRNEAANPKTGTDPLQASMLKQLTSINDTLASKTKENIWATAQGAGVIQDAPAFDVSNLGTALQAVDMRMKSIGQVEAWAGHKTTPLQPQEAEQLAAKLKTLPPHDAAEFLGELGAKVGDPARVNTVADQLSHGDMPFNLAMKLNDRTTAGRTVGELVLRGAQSLADKTVKRDDSALSGWRSEIAGMIRGTLGSEAAENDAINSAYYVRAAMDNPATAPQGMSLRANSENAVKLVVGQPMDRGGVKTILPRGMDERTFTDKLREYTPDALTSLAPSGTVFVRGQPVKVNQLSNRLPDMGMRRNPSGGYTPVSGGAFVTLDKDGTVPLNLPVR